MKHLVWIPASLVALGLGSSPARADVSAAARAFSDGQAAQLEGNNERAAQSFELAYHIAPSKEALRSAVRARMLANQLPRAATLAHLLLTQYSDDATSVKLASEVIGEARTKLGRITVTCAPRCTLAIDGRANSMDASPGHVAYAVPGRHTLEVTFEGDRSVTRDIAIKIGDEIAIPVDPPPPPVKRPDAPPRPAAMPRTSDHGLTPYWTIGGGALTVVLAGITTWSGLDTNQAHDAYVAVPTHQGWEDGRAKQLRTNILIGTTIAAGVTTALIAVLWTRWDDSPREVAVTPAAGGATLSFGGRF